MGEEALFLYAGLPAKTLDVCGFALVGRSVSNSPSLTWPWWGERMVESPYTCIANIFKFFQTGILRRKACKPPLLAEDQEALMSCSLLTQLVMTFAEHEVVKNKPRKYSEMM